MEPYARLREALAASGLNVRRHHSPEVLHVLHDLGAGRHVLPGPETAISGFYAPYTPVHNHHTRPVLWETLRALKHPGRAQTGAAPSMISKSEWSLVGSIHATMICAHLVAPCQSCKLSTLCMSALCWAPMGGGGRSRGGSTRRRRTSSSGLKPSMRPYCSTLAVVPDAATTVREPSLVAQAA